jgi:hypothetical protein
MVYGGAWLRAMMMDVESGYLSLLKVNGWKNCNSGETLPI